MPPSQNDGGRAQLPQNRMTNSNQTDLIQQDCNDTSLLTTKSIEVGGIDNRKLTIKQQTDKRQSSAKGGRQKSCRTNPEATTKIGHTAQNEIRTTKRSRDTTGEHLVHGQISEDKNSYKRNKWIVSLDDFDLLKVLGTGAYGKVFLVRKLTGHDKGKLYAMKVLRKEIVAQKTKTLDHTKTERKVLESIRNEPFLVTMHYAFQTKTKLHLILDYVNGGELFTHLYQRDHFKEDDVKIYIGELILALEKLHKVSVCLFSPVVSILLLIMF